MREWVGVARQFLCRSCIEHVLMFGASLANCFATWRTAIAQSGRLSCGSLLANQRRRSAIRQSFVAGRPAAARARQCALAGQRTASRSRGFCHRWLALEVGIAKLECIEAVTANVLRHRPKKSHITALHRPLCIRQNLWQSRQGEGRPQVPEIKIHGKVYVFSTPSTSRTCLTVRSTRTSMLRMAAG